MTSPANEIHTIPSSSCICRTSPASAEPLLLHLHILSSANSLYCISFLSSVNFQTVEMDCFPAEVDKLGITMYAKDLMPAEHKPSRRARTYTFHENQETQDHGNYPWELLLSYSLLSPRVLVPLSSFFSPYFFSPGSVFSPWIHPVRLISRIPSIIPSFRSYSRHFS